MDWEAATSAISSGAKGGLEMLLQNARLGAAADTTAMNASAVSAAVRVVLPSAQSRGPVSVARQEAVAAAAKRAAPIWLGETGGKREGVVTCAHKNDPGMRSYLILISCGHADEVAELSDVPEKAVTYFDHAVLRGMYAREVVGRSKRSPKRRFLSR